MSAFIQQHHWIFTSLYVATLLTVIVVSEHWAAAWARRGR